MVYASAWELSKAGIIPSSFVSSSKASIASSSVTDVYVALFMSRK